MVPSKTEQTKNVAIKQQVSICPTLSGKEAEYVAAKLGTRIRAFVNEKKLSALTKELIKLITNAAIDTGQLKSINEKIYVEEANKEVFVLEITAKRLAELINNDFPAATIEEIQIAFKSGASGKYGEFMGLNLKTFNSWIKAYVESEEVKRALKAQSDYNLSLMNEQKVMDEVRSAEENKRAAEKMITEFRQNHEKITGLQLFIFKQWAAQFYERNPSLFPEIDLEVEEQALENVMNETNKEANSLHERRRIKQEIDKVRSQMFDNIEVKTEYKYLMVKGWILK